jgi:hypothetical protein
MDKHDRGRNRRAELGCPMGIRERHQCRFSSVDHRRRRKREALRRWPREEVTAGITKNEEGMLNTSAKQGVRMGQALFGVHLEQEEKWNKQRGNES